MKRTDVTYGQLDKVLRSLGFSHRPAKNDPPGHVYAHHESGAVIVLPATSSLRWGDSTSRMTLW